MALVSITNTVRRYIIKRPVFALQLTLNKSQLLLFLKIMHKGMLQYYNRIITWMDGGDVPGFVRNFSKSRFEKKI